MMTIFAALVDVRALPPPLKPFLPVSRGYHRIWITPGWGTPESALQVGVHVHKSRRFELYLPRCYPLGKHDTNFSIPLWVLAPGTQETGDNFFKQTGLKSIADQHCIAMAVLEGEEVMWYLKLSVGHQAQALPWPWPDDIEYTKAVLRETLKRINVDRKRINCVGFSRGA